MCWPAVGAVAGAVLSNIGKKDGDSEETQRQESGTTKTEPWGPSVPYLTGGGLLPQYLTKPIPDYNPAWLQWNKLASMGKATGPAPPMFLFGSPNEGYGGIIPIPPQETPAQAGPDLQTILDIIKREREANAFRDKFLSLSNAFID